MRALYMNTKDISRLGFGAWPLGNISKGVVMSEAEGIALVQQAYQQGVNYFDTAPNYSGGQSEVILGHALKEVRKDVVINTKVGHTLDGELDFSEAALLSSLEGSLKRLQTSYVDSLLLHNPGLDILAGKTGHFELLKSLKKSGKILGFGVSIDTYEELKLVLKQDQIDVIELLYNVFAQDARPLLEKVHKRHISLIIKVPLDSGWLTGHYTQKTEFNDIRSRWTPEVKARRHSLVESLKELVGDANLTPYAMGFLYAYPEVTCVIPGVRTQAQLEEHVKIRPISKELKNTFETFYDQHIQDSPLPW